MKNKYIKSNHCSNLICDGGIGLSAELILIIDD